MAGVALSGALLTVKSKAARPGDWQSQLGQDGRALHAYWQTPGTHPENERIQVRIDNIVKASR